MPKFKTYATSNRQIAGNFQKTCVQYLLRDDTNHTLEQLQREIFGIYDKYFCIYYIFFWESL